MFAGKKIVRTPFFAWRFAASELSFARLGFVFARQSGNSVLRHKFKRRFRELTRVHGKKTALNIVITPQKKLSEISDAQWQEHKTRFIEFLTKNAA